MSSSRLTSGPKMSKSALSLTPSVGEEPDQMGVKLSSQSGPSHLGVGCQGVSPTAGNKMAEFCDALKWVTFF